jgi:hypothetical protein
VGEVAQMALVGAKTGDDEPTEAKSRQLVGNAFLGIRKNRENGRPKGLKRRALLFAQTLEVDRDLSARHEHSFS